ncbi:MAG: TolC family protein [Bacteroidia bacterium]|nr:TolC family protein [Bacteroidia bacterium]
MNCLRLICLLPALWLAGALAAQPADTLTLEQTVARAQARSLPALRACADLLQAGLRHRSFRAGLLPQVALSGSVPNFINTFSQTTQPDGTIAFQRITYNNSSLALEATQAIAPLGMTLFVQTSLQRYDDFQAELRSYNAVPVRAGFVQPLSAYNPLRWQARLDPLRLREAQKQYQFDLEAVRTAAQQLFFELLLAQIDGELAESNLAISETLYAIAQERYGLGKISQNDLLQLELERVNALKARQDAAQAADQARAQLAAFLGGPIEGPLHLVAPPPDSLPPVDAADALMLAAARRPEFETWRRSRMEAAEQTARAQARNGFQATIQASVGTAGSAAALAPLYRSPQPEQAVMMELSIPLLNWGRAKAETGLMRQEEAYLAAWQDQQQQRMELDLRQTLAACERLQRALRLAAQAEDIARSQSAISQARYRLGEISTTDLTLSLRARDLARRAYAASLRDYWQARQSLRMFTLYDFAAGTPISYPEP